MLSAYCTSMMGLQPLSSSSNAQSSWPQPPPPSPPPPTPAPQERIAALKARLAEESKARGELEEAHQERVRELHRRLQAEHLLRCGTGDLGRVESLG